MQGIGSSLETVQCSAPLVSAKPRELCLVLCIFFPIACCAGLMLMRENDTALTAYEKLSGR